jgi:hypothetical protein
MNAQVADAKLAAERAKAKWDHILNVIGGITALFSVGLIIASAVFGAIISPILAGTLAAIGLAVAVTQICSALINWLFPVNYPIKTSITTLFPSGK